LPEEEEVHGRVENLMSLFKEAESEQDRARCAEAEKARVSVDERTKAKEDDVDLEEEDFEDVKCGGCDEPWDDDEGEFGTAKKKEPKIDPAAKGEMRRAKMHWINIRTCFPNFECKCAFARRNGVNSCLDLFSKQDMMVFYSETYGVADPSKDPEDDLANRTRLDNMSLKLYRQMWDLRVAAGAPGKRDGRNRLFSITKWSLNGTETCKAAWIAARGGADRRHRSLCKHAFDPSARAGCRCDTACIHPPTPQQPL
jgi:hypothetical protein